MDPVPRTNFFLIALNHQGKCDEAIQSFNEESQLDPDNALAYNNRGNALYTRCLSLCLLNKPSSSLPNELL
jgi:lipoprotein NlpI